MPEVDCDPVACVTQLIATFLKKTRYAEFADDVAHELYCEIRRQPSTARFVHDNHSRIQEGAIPGRLRKRALAIASAMNSARVRLDEYATIEVADERASRDREIQHSAWAARELCDRFPLFHELLKAERAGWTKEQLKQTLGLSDRRYYSEIRRARKLFRDD
jgi:hypothetical protein